MDLEKCVITGDTAGWVTGSFHSDPSLTCAQSEAALGAQVCGHFEPPLEKAAGGPGAWFSDYFTATIAAPRWIQVVTADKNGGFTDRIVAFFPN